MVMVMVMRVPMFSRLPIGVGVQHRTDRRLAAAGCMGAMRSVRAAFRLEGFFSLTHDQVHRAQHGGQHMVGFDLEMVGLQLDRHMTVAQVVGRTRQIERRAVRGAMRDDQHRLRRCDHADQ